MFDNNGAAAAHKWLFFVLHWGARYGRAVGLIKGVEVVNAWYRNGSSRVSNG